MPLATTGASDSGTFAAMALACACVSTWANTQAPLPVIIAGAELLSNFNALRTSG